MKVGTDSYLWYSKGNEIRNIFLGKCVAANTTRLSMAVRFEEDEAEL
jgi:hypothetical protein